MSKEQLKNQDALFQRYQRVFSTPEGQKVLQDLANNFHVFGIAKGDNSHDTYFRDGQRSVIMHILAYLSMDLNKFRGLMKQTMGDSHDEI